MLSAPPDPFVIALDALFRAPGSVVATFAPAVGDPFEVRVIRDNGREVQDSVIMDTEAVQIRRSEVARPAAGDRIEFADEAFTIQSPPQLDRERLTWTCLLEPA